MSQPAERERLAALLRQSCPDDTETYADMADRLIEAGVRLSGDDEGLRAALRAEVDEWKRLTHRRTGHKDADEGYSAGLSHAVFVVEELLDTPPATEEPSE